jgi:lysophospholipase L1-like esterase
MADRMQTGNKLIKEFLDKQKNTSFVNVWDEMLGPDKKPDPSIFIEDMLHMNAKGYEIWQKKIGPELVK